MVAENQYAQARQTFLRFKAGLENDRDVLRELLAAFELLLNERSTTYHENRFIVGGAAEHMVAASMRCVGLENVEVVGFREVGPDLRVAGMPIFLKSAFTGSNPIALINTQGEGEVRWTMPTVLILATGPSRGISYADPELLPNFAHREEGQLVLPRTPLNEMLNANPEYLLRCNVPANPGPYSDDAQPPRAISEVVASDVLRRTDTGQSLFSDNVLQEFWQRMENGNPLFPRLRACMEADDDGA